MTTGIAVTVTCRRGGREHVPTHADYVGGTWRLCGACRDTDQDSAIDPNPKPQSHRRGTGIVITVETPPID
jgi:hypothetical protein